MLELFLSKDGQEKLREFAGFILIAAIWLTGVEFFVAIPIAALIGLLDSLILGNPIPERLDRASTYFTLQVFVLAYAMYAKRRQ